MQLLVIEFTILKLFDIFYAVEILRFKICKVLKLLYLK